MSLPGALVVTGTFVWAAYHYAERLAPRGERQETRKWLATWFAKGLAAPVLLWIIFNLGHTPILPPMFPSVARAAAQGWIWWMCAVTAPAVAIAGTYWATLTYGWLIFRQATDANRMRHALIMTGVWALVLSPLEAAVLFIGGLEGIGLAFLPVLLPVLHQLTADQEPHTTRSPIYARAIANMKMGRYEQAEQAVLAELEHFEDDFDGWMMLAELYASHFHDLGEASRTVRDIITHPEVTPTQISLAYHRLADWHLKYGNDPASARRALEAIDTRLPGTHLARMARLRMNQIPATEAEFAEQRKGHKVRMPALHDDVEAPEGPHLDPADARLQADECVAKLTRNPDDAATREKLARLLAEELGQPAAGIDQLRLVAAMPDQDEQQQAERLALIGAWQLSRLHDSDAARETLLRIVDEYPKSPQAFVAQRQLSLMKADARLAKIKAAGKLPGAGQEVPKPGASRLNS
jgi:tetratricopeptide (TPR) repeat protein